MPGADDPQRAVVVLVVGDQEVLLGPIAHRVRCDLVLIDGLLRLRVAVARRGWSMRLDHVDPETRALIEFVGLGDCLGL
ncbi:MAG TPA: hypothetical protein VM282_24060 [Acidimicrobiales bacterium]|nr:hypothetical protein [Acidimicrobiales bacterium]